MFDIYNKSADPDLEYFVSYTAAKTINSSSFSNLKLTVIALTLFP